MLIVPDTVNIDKRNVQNHVSTSKEKLLKVGKNCMKSEKKGPKEFKKEWEEERQQSLEKKLLHKHVLSKVQGGIG